MTLSKVSAVSCLALWLSACSLAEAPGTRTVFAHRGAAGYYPENSASAVRASVAAGYPGIEVDIVLTKDGVPVLAHDAWLSETLCTDAAGGALGERIFIKDLTLEALQAGYLCGGVPDPDNPDAMVVAEPVMSLDEMIAELRGSFIEVYLDLKYDPETTLPFEDFRDQILSRWRQSRLTNALYVEVGFEDAARAFIAEGARTLISWPRFVPGTSGVGQAVGTELTNSLGTNDPIDLVHDLGATGFVSTYETLKYRVADAARLEGVTVSVFTLNSESLLDRYCDWPIDILITDYPERAPCL